MTLLQFLGYLSDAWVLVTYFVLTHTGKHTVAFHWANALGAAPILVAEVQLGAWQVLPLTGTFCALGWYGLFKTWRAKRARAEQDRAFRTIVDTGVMFNGMPVHTSPYVPKGTVFLLNKNEVAAWVHNDDIGDR